VLDHSQTLDERAEPLSIDAFTYDAFMSYSHAEDGKLTPAMQSALQQFVKPWYRLRAMRVLRAQTSLSERQPGASSGAEAGRSAKRSARGAPQALLAERIESLVSQEHANWASIQQESKLTHLC